LTVESTPTFWYATGAFLFDVMV